MTPQETASHEWKIKARNASPLAGRHNYTIGISDFKSALRAEIEKEIQIPQEQGATAYDGLSKALELLDTVTPKTK